MQEKQLFRKAAIEKLSSPEQLDVLMKVTSPKGWMALCTLGAIVVAVTVWGIFGSVPERVAGEGILVGGTVFSIQSPARGEIERLAVDAGDIVAANQVVAAVHLPNLEQEIENARQRYESLRASYEQRRRDHLANARAWQQQIDRRESDIAALERERAQQVENLNNPNLARNVVQRRIDEIDRSLTTFRGEVESYRGQERSSEQAVDGARLQMEEAMRNWDSLRNQRSSSSEIKSNVAGRVIEVPRKQGDQVNAGDVIVRIQELGQELEARFYVPSHLATTIEVGDEVEISPAGVPKEEYGFVRGTVVDRTQTAVSQEQLLRDFGGDQSRVAEIREASGAVYRVTASLTPADTPSGFAWSSGQGYPALLESNSDIDVSVIVDRQPPYQFVIPAIRRAVGGG